MYEFLSGLLADKKSETVFTCFGIWHLIYLAAIFGAIVVSILLLKKKSTEAKHRAIDVAIGLAFGLYVADFFLMPFAYGEIDIEKLPFHACTAMCVMCFLSRHNRFLSRFKTQFTLLGLISNLVYVIYPAGVGWYAIHPLSYRVWQTLLFHGAMTAYGIFALAFSDIELSRKDHGKNLLTVSVMTMWALIGNTLYNGERFYNWFFVVRDPFYILPDNIAPFIMPFLTTVVFFAAEMIVYAVCSGIKRNK